MDLLQCGSLVALLPTARENAYNRDYLRSSRCGGNFGGVRACCPIYELQGTGTSGTGTSGTGNKEDLLPGRNVCGQQSHSNIIGGEVTNINEFPWTVQMWYNNSKFASG